MKLKAVLTTLLTGLALIQLAACAPSNPNRVVRNPAPAVPPPQPLPQPPNPEKPLEQPAVHYFEFSSSMASFTQAKYDENVISASFTVTKDDKSVNDLRTKDLRVQENGVPVPNFKLDSEKQRFDQIADIVFVVDITGTMTKFIDTAKARLKEFIKSSRAQGYHTRMCIATFGDYTVKKCTRFFDNNPRDPATEVQVKELLSELADLEAYKGNGKDPGWPDLDENPMGALIDASTAPWAESSQRFVILVTDWSFLYSPDNQGTIGDKAPHMSQVTQAIKSSGMTVFAVTPNLPGYNSPFQGEPGIVQASGGEFFEFKKVIAGKGKKIDEILNRILYRINTTYTLSYVVDRVPGLDPTLPVEKRQLSIATANPSAGIVQIKSLVSSMPTGRPQYQQSWEVADKAVHPESLKVYINDAEVPSSQYTVDQTRVSFRSVPRAGAKLLFVYDYEAIEKNLRMEPMTFAGDVSAENTKVYLNDKEAAAADLSFTKDLDGNTGLKINESAMAANDPYDIRKNKSLTVKVVRIKN